MDVGLDAVVAAETVLSHVDGQAGRLVLRGFDLEELAGRRSYEAVLALLWQGFAPVDDIAAALGRARVEAFRILEPRLPALDGLTPIEAVRGGLALLADAEAKPHHLLATAAASVLAAAASRRAAGRPALAPIQRWGTPPTSCACCAAMHPRPPMPGRSTPIS